MAFDHLLSLLFFFVSIFFNNNNNFRRPESLPGKLTPIPGRAFSPIIISSLVMQRNVKKAAIHYSNIGDVMCFLEDPSDITPLKWAARSKSVIDSNHMRLRWSKWTSNPRDLCKHLVLESKETVGSRLIWNWRAPNKLWTQLRKTWPGERKSLKSMAGLNSGRISGLKDRE